MFTLQADYAIHEGGAKFYQVFNVWDNETGNGCVVTHWGSYTAGAPRAPKLHGKAIKIDVYKHGRSHSKAREVKKMKSSRGYSNWSGHISENRDTEAFATILEGWFKQADSELIMSHIVGMSDEPWMVDELLGFGSYKVEKPDEEAEIERNRLMAERLEQLRLDKEVEAEKSRIKQLADERYGAW